MDLVVKCKKFLGLTKYIDANQEEVLKELKSSQQKVLQLKTELEKLEATLTEKNQQIETLKAQDLETSQENQVRLFVGVCNLKFFSFFLLLYFENINFKFDKKFFVFL